MVVNKNDAYFFLDLKTPFIMILNNDESPNYSKRVIKHNIGI